MLKHSIETENEKRRTKTAAQLCISIFLYFFLFLNNVSGFFNVKLTQSNFSFLISYFSTIETQVRTELPFPGRQIFTLRSNEKKLKNKIKFPVIEIYRLKDLSEWKRKKKKNPRSNWNWRGTENIWKFEINDAPCGRIADLSQKFFAANEKLTKRKFPNLNS